jgi:hypothetical protein
LYKKGQISDIVFLEGIRPPIRRKLKKGEWFRGIDYDGNNRAFRGQVETDGNWAKNTSANFLMSFVPTYPYSIVVCTGTEYSEYIEEGDLNVMTETSLYAKVKSLMLFKSNFKKI